MSGKSSIQGPVGGDTSCLPRVAKPSIVGHVEINARIVDLPEST